MQRAEDQMARFRGGNRQLNGFQIAHFTHENHVGIFAQRRPQCAGKTFRVITNLPLTDQTFDRIVNKLQGIFQRQNMFVAGLINMMDERRQSGGFTTARGTGHQDQSILGLTHGLENWRGFQFFKRQHLKRNNPEGGGNTGQLLKDVNAKPGDSRCGIGKIKIVSLLEPFNLILGQNLINHRLQDVIGQRGAQWLERSLQPQEGARSGCEVQIRCPLLHHRFKEIVELCHSSRYDSRQPP